MEEINENKQNLQSEELPQAQEAPDYTIEDAPEVDVLEFWVDNPEEKNCMIVHSHLVVNGEKVNHLNIKVSIKYLTTSTSKKDSIKIKETGIVEWSDIQFSFTGNDFFRLLDSGKYDMDVTLTITDKSGVVVAKKHKKVSVDFVYKWVQHDLFTVTPNRSEVHASNVLPGDNEARPVKTTSSPTSNTTPKESEEESEKSSWGCSWWVILIILYILWKLLQFMFQDAFYYQ